MTSRETQSRAWAWGSPPQLQGARSSHTAPFPCPPVRRWVCPALWGLQAVVKQKTKQTDSKRWWHLGSLDLRSARQARPGILTWQELPTRLGRPWATQLQHSRVLFPLLRKNRPFHPNLAARSAMHQCGPTGHQPDLVSLISMSQSH